MKMQGSVRVSACPAIQGEQPGNRQWHDDNRKRPSLFGWIVLIVMTLMLVIPTTAMSAKGGNGNGGGGGGGSTTGDIVDFGDVFGDLIHILRDDLTGQPIFAQRWVEMPEGEPGFGWGYCAIGIDEDGYEIPFQPFSCDLDTSVYASVEVDYFGRLNASRVQERNQRMHFNETITNIKQAVRLRTDPTGRLDLGFEDPDNPEGCANAAEDCIWATVDSPMENMALYQRMMKYGHIATDPEEPDLWWHGDPKLPIPAHPALGPNDFDKFVDAGLDNWLPGEDVWDDEGNFIRDHSDCFTDDKKPEPIIPCLPPEELTPEDFDTSAELLGAAGGKHNFFTVHLVQYLNRFLRITQTTQFAAATLATLPAKYRDCWQSEVIPDDPPELPDGQEWEFDLVYPYSGDGCVVGDVVDEDGEWMIPNWEFYTNVQELFMDFGNSAYVRSGNGGIWNERTAPLALEATLDPGPVTVTSSASKTPRVQGIYGPTVDSTPGANSDIFLTVDTVLLDWIEDVNDYEVAESDIHNFVDAASDALRAIEYFHEYAVPENLYCTYAITSCD